MITFSGIDCSGKTTIIGIVKKYYQDRDVKCCSIWSRGGYTLWVEGFKNLIRKDKHLSKEEKALYRIEALASTRKNKLLLWASIADLIRFYGIILRWIEFMGNEIICDRYIWDTYIDFKLKFKDIHFEKWLVWKALIFFMKKPSKSIIFVIPVEESMRRSELKYEPFPESFDERVIRIAEYMKEIRNGKWQYVINTEGELEEVARKVFLILENTL